MSDLKQTYMAVAVAFLILLALFAITFIIIRANKGAPLFDNVAITISLTISLLILFVGGIIALYFRLKK
jgi:uncharacterized membrane protein